MQYLGGKTRLVKHIAPIINAALDAHPDRVYVEPFVGGCNVLPHIKAHGTNKHGVSRFAFDASQALITMYRALQNGWQPPTEVSRELYAQYKATKDPFDPLTAFIGFACSFGGQWYRGYGAYKRVGSSYSVAAQARIAIRDNGGAYFGCLSFFDIPAQDMRNAVVYCDPPYAATSQGYDKSCGTFDSAAFWQHAERMAAHGAIVFVSEYAKRAYTCVMQRDHGIRLNAGIDGAQGIRTEYLYRLG